MKSPSRSVLLLNAAVGIIVIGSVVAVARSWMPEETPPCGDRYRKGMLFAVEQPPGKLMTGADLQSRLGVDEWGVLDNVAAVAVADGPARHALKVKLEPATARGSGDSGARRYGMGFTWMPRALAGTRAACLTYSVRVPDGFEFGRGGQLPGLTAGSSESALDASAVLSRLQWRGHGQGEVTARISTGTERREVVLARDAFNLTPGRWTTLEHEVVLNSPGAADGVIRLWVDGRLKLESKGLVLSERDEQPIGGVAAEVSYGAGQQRAAPPAGLELMITPFELRWP